MYCITPYAYVQRVAGALDSLLDRQSLETALDELAYLYEVMDPELQESAEQVMAALRDRLQKVI